MRNWIKPDISIITDYKIKYYLKSMLFFIIVLSVSILAYSYMLIYFEQTNRSQMVLTIFFYLTGAPLLLLVFWSIIKDISHSLRYYHIYLPQIMKKNKVDIEKIIENEFDNRKWKYNKNHKEPIEIWNPIISYYMVQNHGIKTQFSILGYLQYSEILNIEIIIMTNNLVTQNGLVIAISPKDLKLDEIYTLQNNIITQIKNLRLSI